MRLVSLIVCGVVVLFSASGCEGPVREQDVEVVVPPPLEQVKTLLQRYAEGQPATSEVTSFNFLINGVKESDAAKGAIVEECLRAIEADPSSAAAKARETLPKL